MSRRDDFDRAGQPISLIGMVETSPWSSAPDVARPGTRTDVRTGNPAMTTVSR
jgi:hypothetical protein